MKRVYLSKIEHQQAADIIKAIMKNRSDLIRLINGKVPAKIIDQVSDHIGLGRSLTKLRSLLEDEMFKRFPETTTYVYYPVNKENGE